MFGTLKTLFTGANARAEEQLRDTFSIELITQKIREADANLKAAKLTLASLIQRQRGEERQVRELEGRVADLMGRAGEALEGGREDLARQAAQAVADMENELQLRRQTVDRLDTRILQLRQSVETASRRITDLKQGAIAARAVKQEQALQRRIHQHTGGTSPAEEAEELIGEVLQREDPFEKGEILKEINDGLGHAAIGDRMAEAGFGASSRSTADDVLAQLAAKD